MNQDEGKAGLGWDGNGADNAGREGHVGDKGKGVNRRKAGPAPCPIGALALLLRVPRFEAELAIRLSVDGDIAGLRKVLDDTNMTRLQLEGDIEALNEELILLRKDHNQVGPGGLGGSGGPWDPKLTLPARRKCRTCEHRSHSRR